MSSKRGLSLGFQLAFISLGLCAAIGRVPMSGSPMPHQNFADPSITWADGKWWSFSTRPRDSRMFIQIASSVDFEKWNLLQHPDGTQVDALGTLPTWADEITPGTWAPDVVKLDDGSYVMYYAARHKNTIGTECIAAAISKTVQGPYRTDGKGPLVCPPDSYGAYDVAGFKDWKIKGNWTIPTDYSAKGPGNSHNSFVNNAWSEGGSGGQRHIVYKVQNAKASAGGPPRTPIMLQKVKADGITLQGDPTKLLGNNGLFMSSNCI